MVGATRSPPTSPPARSCREILGHAVEELIRTDTDLCERERVKSAYTITCPPSKAVGSHCRRAYVDFIG